MNTHIEISIRTIILTVATVLTAWLIYYIRDIIFLLFISFLLMTAIQPLVVFLERFRIPRVIGILFVYAVVFGFFGASLVGAIPVLVNQTTRLIMALPDFISRVLPSWQFELSALTQQIAPIGESIIGLTVSIFENVVTLVTVMVFSFYFLMGRRNAEELITGFVGDTFAVKILGVLRSIERRIGSWIRGQLILMVFVGVLSFIGLSILRVDYALPLAILAGLLEIVPMIGPLVSAIPAVLVALSVSPFLALSVAALYIIVQQVENNVLVPIIMRRSVGFPPIVTILILMIGGRVAGVVGAVLSIPIALVIQEIIQYFFLDIQKTGNRIIKNPSKKEG